MQRCDIEIPRGAHTLQTSARFSVCERSIWSRAASRLTREQVATSLRHAYIYMCVCVYMYLEHSDPLSFHVRNMQPIRRPHVRPDHSYPKFFPRELFFLFYFHKSLASDRFSSTSFSRPVSVAFSKITKIKCKSYVPCISSKSFNQISGS